MFGRASFRVGEAKHGRRSSHSHLPWMPPPRRLLLSQKRRLAPFVPRRGTRARIPVVVWVAKRSVISRTRVRFAPTSRADAGAGCYIFVPIAAGVRASSCRYADSGCAVPPDGGQPPLRFSIYVARISSSSSREFFHCGQRQALSKVPIAWRRKYRPLFYFRFSWLIKGFQWQRPARPPRRQVDPGTKACGRAF